MPDVPKPAISAGAEAVNEAHAKRGWNKPAPWWTEEVATAVLEAAVPLLAEAVAQKILAHMNEHIADPAKVRLTRVAEVGNRAARRHFRTAAQIAGLAFYADEDMKRLAAEAIAAGNVAWCVVPEDGENVSAHSAPTGEDGGS
jgi:hypothetical protein